MTFVCLKVMLLSISIRRDFVGEIVANWELPIIRLKTSGLLIILLGALKLPVKFSLCLKSGDLQGTAPQF